MRAITSRQNPLVARYRDAARGDAIDLALLDGLHLVSEAVAARLPLEHVFVASEAVEHDDVRDLMTALSTRGVRVDTASATVMSAVSPLRSPSPVVALVSRASLPGSAFRASPHFIVVACDIQDPGNLGAMARVSEAAGASGFLVAGGAADPHGWKALRGSMGSLLRLPVERCDTVTDAEHSARARDCRIVATTPRGGSPLFAATLRGSIAIFIGGEGPGLPEALVNRADERISIPMAAPVESLNAAVTTALIAYEAKRQRG